MIRAVAITLICSQLCACLGPTWQSHEVTPELAAMDASAERVRLTLNNDSVLVASHPKLVGDSLVWVGRPDGKRLSPGDSTVRFAIALDQIATMERFDQTDGQKAGTSAATALLVVGPVLMLLGMKGFMKSK